MVRAWRACTRLASALAAAAAAMLAPVLTRPGIADHSQEDGTAYIEYIVLAAVAVIVLLAVIQGFFGGIANLFTRLTNTLNGI